MGRNNSFEKIDYSLRPAKSIERKILIQFFKKLCAFGCIEDYHYIGFGSIYYSDFILMHKLLNVKKLSSIEYARNEKRAKFNLPFSCIDLHPGLANTKLSTLLHKDEKNITWLDYDIPLNSDVLSDIQTYIANTSTGSMLLITVNANADDIPCNTEDEFLYRKELLEERIGSAKMPYIKKPIELNHKNLHKCYRQIISNEIEETLTNRNINVDEDFQFISSQIINFTYSDNSKMMTIGYVFYQKKDQEIFDKCNFQGLRKFYKDTEEAYHINLPKMTTHEKKSVDSLLPVENIKSFSFEAIDDRKFTKALRQYAEIYQYFPNYSEALHL